MSAISRRQGGEAPRLLSLDASGRRDSDRPRLPYNAELLASFLADFRRDHYPADCGLIGAGIVVLLREQHSHLHRHGALSHAHRHRHDHHQGDRGRGDSHHERAHEHEDAPEDLE